MFSIVDGLDCRLPNLEVLPRVLVCGEGLALCVKEAASKGWLGLDRRPKGVGTRGLDKVVGNFQVGLLCRTLIASNDRIGIIPEATP